MKDPFIISTIILSLAYIFLLIFNNFYKKKMLKILFLILTIIYLGVIFFFDSKFIYELLKAIITYTWYPTYLIFLINIIFSILLLVYTLFNEKELFIKIINYIIFALNTSMYVIFQRLNIDLESYASIYSHGSITLLRISSMSILVWLVIMLTFKLIKRGNNEK